MRESIFLAAALTIVLPAAVQAQSVCVAPTAPDPINGAIASQEEVLAAMRDAKEFIAQSELYQTCLAQEMEDARAHAAAENRPVDLQIARLIGQSQKLKEKVGAEANSAVDAYKKAHP
jgi:hypothetical protein